MKAEGLGTRIFSSIFPEPGEVSGGQVPPAILFSTGLVLQGTVDSTWAGLTWGEMSAPNHGVRCHVEYSSLMSASETWNPNWERDLASSWVAQHPQEGCGPIPWVGWVPACMDGQWTGISLSFPWLFAEPTASRHVLCWSLWASCCSTRPLISPTSADLSAASGTLFTVSSVRMFSLLCFLLLSFIKPLPWLRSTWRLTHHTLNASWIPPEFLRPQISSPWTPILYTRIEAVG